MRRILSSVRKQWASQSRDSQSRASPIQGFPLVSFQREVDWVSVHWSPRSWFLGCQMCISSLTSSYWRETYRHRSLYRLTVDSHWMRRKMLIHYTKIPSQVYAERSPWVTTHGHGWIVVRLSAGRKTPEKAVPAKYAQMYVTQNYLEHVFQSQISERALLVCSKKTCFLAR